MSFLEENCTLRVLNEALLAECEPFDCDHNDLNEFFCKDCIEYERELLGKTYCFTLNHDPKIIICAFTVSNDSIKTYDLPNARKKKVIKDIPRAKHFRSYPSVLIGRLGVHKNYAGNNIGCDLMDFIKAWFVDTENKTGCRFIAVDSYNEERPRGYYNKCGFSDLFSTEQQEKEYLELPEDAELTTRLMYFDLIVLVS